MQHMMTHRQWGVFGILLLLGLLLLLAAARDSTAQGNVAAKPRYRADVVVSAAAGASKAVALEVLLNKRAEEGYELFDIDRDATGNTLVVFQRAKQ